MNNPKNYTNVQKLVILADACSEVVYGGNRGWERVDFDQFVSDVKKKLREGPQANPPAQEKAGKASTLLLGNLDVTFRFPKNGGFILEFETDGKTFSFQDSDTEELEETLCDFLANLFPDDYSSLVEDFDSKEIMSFEVGEGEATFSLHKDEHSCRIDIDTDEGDYFEGGEYKFGSPDDMRKLMRDFIGLLVLINPTTYQNLWEECPYT